MCNAVEVTIDLLSASLSYRNQVSLALTEPALDLLRNTVTMEDECIYTYIYSFYRLFTKGYIF
jgi:hypothetical protein